MRLVYLIRSNQYYVTEIGEVIKISIIPERFKRLVSWLCECIKQDTEPLTQAGKMLIMYLSGRNTNFDMAQALKVEVEKKFPEIRVELRQIIDESAAWMEEVMEHPQSILRDRSLLFELLGGDIRYLIGIF